MLMQLKLQKKQSLFLIEKKEFLFQFISGPEAISIKKIKTNGAKIVL